MEIPKLPTIKQSDLVPEEDIVGVINYEIAKQYGKYLTEEFERLLVGNNSSAPIGIITSQKENHMSIEASTFVRKPFNVSAVRVTAGNLNQVAEWCKGELDSQNAKPFIKLAGNKDNRHKQAFIGDWVVFNGKFFQFYSDRAFNATFEAEEVVAEENKKLMQLVELVAPVCRAYEEARTNTEWHIQTDFETSLPILSIRPAKSRPVEVKDTETKSITTAYVRDASDV